MTHHEYSESPTTYEPIRHITIGDHVTSAFEEHRGKIAAITGLATVALMGIGLNHLNGGTSDASRFEHSDENITVTVVEGANIRVDPFVTGEPAANTLEEPVTISTTKGTYSHAESANGHWLGLNKDDAANLGVSHDNDNVIWVNVKNIDSSED